LERRPEAARTGSRGLGARRSVADAWDRGRARGDLLGRTALQPGADRTDDDLAAHRFGAERVGSDSNRIDADGFGSVAAHPDGAVYLGAEAAAGNAPLTADERPAVAASEPLDSLRLLPIQPGTLTVWSD